MDDTNLKSEGQIAVSSPAKPRVCASGRTVSLGAAAILILAAIVAQANGAAKGKAEAEQEKDVPHSVFVVPANLQQGRNPFYPHSTRGMTQQQQAPVRPSQPTIDISDLTLNGIVPTGARPSAMINGRTFEVGEEGEVRLPNGQKLPVKLEEIREDSVTVSVRGQRRELRLRRGL
jgi:hypothetical protein